MDERVSSMDKRDKRVMFYFVRICLRINLVPRST